MDHFSRRPERIRLLYCFQAVALLCVLYVRFCTGFQQEDPVPAPTAVDVSTAQALTPTAAAAPLPAVLSTTAATQTAAQPPVNILLIGQDRREGERCARADSAIVCTYRQDTETLILTSFLRDLYLQIPGIGGDRINAAYAYGGRDLLRQTIEENFDIPIHGCVEVDFGQFSGIIDTLGGVTLELRQDEAEAINAAVPGTLTEGLQHLNGSQTLAYTRIRNLDADGDFSRTGRQRRVMTALTEHFRQLSIFKAAGIVADILPMVSTDMDQKQILSLTAGLLPQLSRLRTEGRSVPEAGTFRFANIRGMDVLQADLDLARAALDYARSGE